MYFALSVSYDVVGGLAQSCQSVQIVHSAAMLKRKVGFNLTNLCSVAVLLFD